MVGDHKYCIICLFSENGVKALVHLWGYCQKH